MAAIVIGDLTDGTVGGTGVFDKLMVAVNVHINGEYTSGRIKGPDYAKVYLGALESTLAQSVAFLMQQQVADKQADLITQKILTEKAQVEDSTAGTTKKQQDLLAAQTAGFARDAEQKVLKIMMDSYAIRRSTDSALPPPLSAEDTDISLVVIKAAAEIGVTLP